MTTFTKLITCFVACVFFGTLTIHADSVEGPLTVNGPLFLNRPGGGSSIRLANQGSFATLQLYTSNGKQKLGIFDGSGGYKIDHLLLRSGDVIELDSQVAIGTTSPVSDYKLTVNGGIYALDLRIRPDLRNTADFVFDESYDLPSLEDVELSIKQNRHLPGIPSAQTMVEEGVSVAEMNAKLLQKIEELTLYVIQQHKEIERLKMKQTLSAAH